MIRSSYNSYNMDTVIDHVDPQSIVNDFASYIRRPGAARRDMWGWCLVATVTFKREGITKI
jgi:hypothetical protein